MKQFIDKFLGPNKIKSAKLAERKTYLGKEICDIEYENEIKELIPLEVVGKAVTDEVSDFTTLRDKMIDPIAENILAILLEAEFPIEHIDYLFQKTGGTINERIRQADSILWKKEHHQRSLADIHQVLLPKNGNNKK
jgi:hypothetical protein